ncbi:hypothetical protein DSO57_1006654 [Entomophthora muscae]|uniref:Uncharacterized protein n=1 Tax=Entomophthora muscae TaxID=34485 RepID=A0ACC2U5A5_9FUNG|nr:hypothetical protein DSO57_1006654 [Entomophthora muscae]
MLMEKSQLQESNPKTLWAASLQFPGLKPERDLTLGNLLSLDEQDILASKQPTPKVPVNPTNESAGQAKDPEITWATVAREAKKLPVECRPPKVDQPCNPKGKFESSQFEPSNKISPSMDATEGYKTLVDSIIRPIGNCKSLSMADWFENYCTLGHQEVAHHHSCNKSTSCSSIPHTQQPQETTNQSPKLYCPPGAPFGPLHFTEYPPNPAYLEFTLEEILIYNPEARTRETKTIGREGTKVIIPPLLFCNKYNYLPTYLVPMTPSLTLWSNCLQESIATNEFTSTHIFGMMYITLTGLINSMMPASSPWALLGKFLYYIIKDVAKAKYKLSQLEEYKKITTVLNGNQMINI